MADTPKSQIDRLGNRLRTAVSADDLQALDAYRQSFAPAYEKVVLAIKSTTNEAVSGRPAKSTTAIIDKLNRESMRLSQMQDIAGCRIVVDNYLRQDSLLQQVGALFPNAQVSDRRKQPSHGYRAVHIIVSHEGRAVEVQIRTQLQHLWAELSEKLSDKFGIEVKYGAGPQKVRALLDQLLNYEIFEVVQHVVAPSDAAYAENQENLALYRDLLGAFLTAVKGNDDFLD